MGLEVEDADSEDENGVVVVDVSETSPAGTAGIRQGDVITEIYSQRVESVKDYAEVSKRLKDRKDPIAFLVKRESDIEVLPGRYRRRSSDRAQGAGSERNTRPRMKKMLSYDEEKRTEGEAESSGGNRSLDVYLHEINRTPLLTREQEQPLARRIRKGDKDALDRLVQGQPALRRVDRQAVLQPGASARGPDQRREPRA